VSEVSSEDKDLSGALINVLINRLGGTASIRPNEFLPNHIHTRATQLPTGTIHLELVAEQPPASDNPPSESTTDGDALMHLGG
jgi:hypothetical protein